MHELMASLFPMHQSLTTTRFCREIRQNAMIRIDIEKLLGYMYVVDLTSSGNCFSADFYFCLISLYLQFVVQLIIVHHINFIGIHFNRISTNQSGQASSRSSASLRAATHGQPLHALFHIGKGIEKKLEKLIRIWISNALNL